MGSVKKKRRKKIAKHKYRKMRRSQRWQRRH
ncbi:MAG: 30S ribosomal protein bS22 [Anaerolineae bacterium]